MSKVYAATNIPISDQFSIQMKTQTEEIMQDSLVAEGGNLATVTEEIYECTSEARLGKPCTLGPEAHAHWIMIAEKS